MNKKAKQKQIAKYMIARFIIYTLSSFTLISILSFIIIMLTDNQIFTGDFGNGIKWISDRIFVIALFMFVVSIFLIFIFQYSQMIRYTATLSATIETINLEKKHDLQLPAIFKSVEEGIQRLQTELMEKERIAREAEQRKNDLIVYLAHDLKTPISSIIGYLILLRDEKNISEEMYQKFTNVAITNAERLDDLIDEFFEITRFNLSNVSLNYSKVNISFMLEQLCFEFQPTLQTKNITYQLQGNKNVEIVCDANKIQRVFDNLISNAVHYSFENSQMAISIKEDADTVVVQFSNECYPVDQEKLSRIFEQFYRLDTSRSTRDGGTGLGLAIAKQIVEQHKGTITAASVNQKITFTVSLPRS
ncbi:two-component system sensor histidine kinase VanS [Metabacillus crassostreae]|uniref:sensor histidine kinase n=1 Tax=Metabacillus crassostreae TaxID=929098 RepID=UPI00195ED4A4|nr:HAMP domain-containing sensor histidine kinase [Metabacillus crassostreae]MBM7602494.1 two-component system sensor histidine kinase VanS [Metabacillus crassostreae]